MPLVVNYSDRERQILDLLQREDTITVEHVISTIYSTDNAPVNARNVAVDLLRRLSRKLLINNDGIEISQFPGRDGRLHYTLKRASIAA